MRRPLAQLSLRHRGSCFAARTIRRTLHRARNIARWRSLAAFKTTLANFLACSCHDSCLLWLSSGEVAAWSSIVKPTITSVASIPPSPNSIMSSAIGGLTVCVATSQGIIGSSPATIVVVIYS